MPEKYPTKNMRNVQVQAVFATYHNCGADLLEGTSMLIEVCGRPTDTTFKCLYCQRLNKIPLWLQKHSQKKSELSDRQIEQDAWRAMDEAACIRRLNRKFAVK